MNTEEQNVTIDTSEASTETIELKAPPNAITPQDASSSLTMVLPLTGSMGVMVFMAISNNNNTRMLFMSGGMVVAMLSMVVLNVYRQIHQHRNNVTNQRREYLGYISEVRSEVREAAKVQRRTAVSHLPEPEALPYLVQHGARVWERRQGQDHLLIRVGRSSQPLAATIEAEEVGPLNTPDPVCLSAMHRFVSTHTEVDALPFGIDLSAFSHIEVVGPLSEARAQVRAMLAHILALTSPSLVQLVVLTSQEAGPEWDWVKWAPHAWSDSVTDAVGPSRLMAHSLDELADKLPEDLSARGTFSSAAGESPLPHVIVLVDGGTLPPSSPMTADRGLQGVTVISISERAEQPLVLPNRLRLVLRPSVGQPGSALSGSLDETAVPMNIELAGQDPSPALADALSINGAEAVARRLVARYQAAGEDVASSAPVGTSDPERAEDLLRLLRLGDVRDFNPDTQWVKRTGAERLSVPFAVTPEGEPVVLDIKESAENGMGPHGLLVGATGSGKSEVLRTLVLALALTHGPDQLNFVLVDFKGGATFAGMSDLPHVSAMISNLESELGLVDRMAEALRGEMNRRQQMLHDAGNYANVMDYEQDRVKGKHNGDPLPALFIILDEFSELLSAKPDFIDTFVAIGRLGRSLQMHLLLSSQRLEEGRLRGLDSHLSYRIGLRTFSASESRTVLGSPDAYHLPPLPGSGYLKSDTETMTRFRASYVAGKPPARRASRALQLPGAAKAAGVARGAVEVLPFTAQDVEVEIAPEEMVIEAEEPAAPEPEAFPQDAAYSDSTTMDIAVDRMTGHGVPAHQIWLPPLEISETFDSLVPDLVVDRNLGLTSPSWRARGDLVVPLGVTDVPLEQRRETLTVDLSGAGGHVAVVGGPLSGKSTALRSLVMALALTRTPAEVQFYVIDLGGGTFSTMLDLPHLSGMATRDEPDIVARTMAEIASLLDDRERYFRANRIDSIQTYRRERAAGRVDDGYGDVFLIIDGWATLKTDFEDISMEVQNLAPRALALGVHFVLSTNRWMDLRAAIRDAIGTRIELRLGDPADSEINRKIARQVPEGRPGRGLDRQARHMLLAQPRIDGDHDDSTLAQGIHHACQQLANAWQGAPGPKLRLLPTQIDLTELQAMVPADAGPVIGIDEARLEPVTLAMQQDPSLIVLGDAKKGKTTFLRALARELVRGKTPDQVRILAIDLRRNLLGEIPEEFLLAYLSVRDTAVSEINDLTGYLQGRLPGPDVTAEQLRNRSWWRGPEIYLLVDDYDLVATNTSNPLAPLQPLLAQAQDIGLHLVLTRRIGGTMRAMYEPIMQTLGDLSTPGIMLPGNPDEGPLLGRQKPQPGPAGRARLISRDGVRTLQLAWTPPTM